MKSQHGFTLIELMVVVVVVAILAAVAIPSYRDHVMKSNRSAAEAFMLQAANREEQIMLDMRSYVAVTDNASFSNAPTAASPGINLPAPDSVANFYTLRIDVPALNTYTITAVPTPRQPDTLCGTLTLNQAGVKTAAAPSRCW